MDFSHILSLLGGIAFFLYGMSAMGKGLNKIAGPKLEHYLWKLSSTPIKGFFLGTLVAGIIQSSGATSVMTVSFVNAGIMKLNQAICIVFGSNVGTTMTGWIITLSDAGGDGTLSQILSVATLIGILAISGVIMNQFIKKTSVQSIGQIFVGLAILLFAMSLISDAVSPLKESESFKSILIMFSNPVLGILAGIFVGGVVQSSSAGVGILQALCITGAIPYSVALPVILGINLGGSVPVLLSMFGASKNGKRTAIGYLFTNAFAIFFVYVMLIPLYFIIPKAFWSTATTKMGIALMNTVMRFTSSVVLVPLNKLVVKLLNVIIKPDPEETEDMDELESLTDSLVHYTPVALEKATEATIKMADIAMKNVFRAVNLIGSFDKTKYQKVQDKENVIDKYEDKVGNFVVKLSGNRLNESQQAKVSELLSAVGDFERLSDHACNISEAALEIYEKKIEFSTQVQNELTLILAATEEVLGLTKTAFKEQNADNAKRIEALKEIIDEMCKVMKAGHIKRIQSSQCSMENGFVFNDIILNLERVSAHCSNIAFCLLHGNDINAEGHEFNESVLTSHTYQNYLADYKERYLVTILNKR